MTRARTFAAVAILVVGAALVVLAYRVSGATWRQLMATNDRLNQDYRCILANGRSLRGATTADCADYWRRVRDVRTP